MQLRVTRRRALQLGGALIALALCLLTASCRPTVSVGGGYEPLIVPIKFSATFTIDPNGNISVGGSVGLITELGIFSVDADVELNATPAPDETILIIRHHRGPDQLVDSAYQIKTGEEIVIALNGRSTIDVLNRRVLIDASKAQITSLVVKNASGASSLQPVIALSTQTWRTFGNAEAVREPGGIIRLTFDQRLTLANKWAGIIANVPRSCGYRIEMQALVVSQPANQGGYGVASGVLDAQSQPHGVAFQYDFGFGGYRTLNYPDDFQQPYHYKSASIDHHWHVLEIVFSRTMTAYVDGQEVISQASPNECGIPIIRVWSATVEVRDIRIQSLAAKGLVNR